MFLFLLLFLAPATAFECNECSMGKLMADGFANIEGCDTMAAQILIASMESDDVSCLDHQANEAHQDRYTKCKAAGNALPVNVAQCLLHSGGKTWVIAVTTALTYVSVLAVAISLRPSLAVKCD